MMGKLKLFFLFVFIYNTSTAQQESSFDEYIVRLKSMDSLAKSFSNVDSSIFYCHQLLEMARNLNDVTEITNALRQLGDSYLRKGDFESAKTHLKECLIVSSKEKDVMRTITILNSLGNVYFYSQDRSKALTYYFDALILLDNQKLNEEVIRLKSFVYNNIAIIYMEQNKYDEARNFYIKSFDLIKRLHKPEEEAMALNNLGDLELQQKNYDQAEKYLTKAINLDIKDMQLFAIINLSFGEVYLATNKLDKALTYIYTGYEISKRNGYTEYESIGTDLIKKILNEIDFCDQKSISDTATAAIDTLIPEKDSKLTIEETSLQYNIVFRNILDLFLICITLIFGYKVFAKRNGSN